MTMEAHFELQDCKTGEYNNDVFAKLSSQLTRADMNKMFSWEDLKKIREVYMNMVARHIIYVMHKMPYNGSITKVSNVKHDSLDLEFSDDNMKILIKVRMNADKHLYCECDNILSIKVTEGYAITVKDIQNTQGQLVAACGKVFAALNKRED